jgi:molybdopterin molybdotransferase
LNVEAMDLGCLPDDEKEIEKTLLAASNEADAVISIGGMSVGDADFVKSALLKHGEILFWKIAMKPGKPLAYGALNGAKFFGLPGNPVSARVTFYQFARDAMLILQGRTGERPPMFKAKLSAPVKKSKGRMEFQRGIVSRENGENLVAPLSSQSSAVLSSMSKANCFIVLPRDGGSLDAGEWVDVELFAGLV